MRKKIGIHYLRPGMYVDGLCGSWIDHPFWKSSFLLNKEKDLKALQDCGIKEVWIDTSKGADLSPQSNAVVDDEVKSVAGPAILQTEDPDTGLEVHVSFDQELDRARNIQGRAKQAVIGMFKDARMGNALNIEEAVTLIDEITKSVSRNPGALLSLARLKTKDDYTYLHSVDVCALMIALGRQRGFKGDALRSLGMAGLLHDVGKVMVPDGILNKPGRLTSEEFEIVKLHSAQGWEIVKTSYDADELVLDVVRHHHERMDGNGYPDKLSGEDWTEFSRMGAVCDVYDAITSDRCYKKGWPPAVALSKMAEWGGQFDEKVFQSFVRTVGIYPTGTLVKLRSGRLGVVTDQTDAGLLKPQVKVFFSGRSNVPIPQEIVNLARSQDVIETVEDPGRWGFDLSKVM